MRQQPSTAQARHSPIVLKVLLNPNQLIKQRSIQK